MIFAQTRMSIGLGLASLSFGNTVLAAVLLPLSLEIGLSEVEAGVVLSIGAMMVLPTAPFWGNLADRTGHRRVFTIGVAGGAASFLGLGFFLWLGRADYVTPDVLFLSLVLMRVVYGGVASATQPAAVGFLACSSCAATRLHALSIPGTAYALGAMVGGALLWALVPVMGLIAPLFIVAAFGCLPLFGAPWPKPANSGTGLPANRTDSGFDLSALICCATVALVGASMVQSSLPLILQTRGVLSSEQTTQMMALAGVASTIASLTGVKLATRLAFTTGWIALVGLFIAAIGFFAVLLATSVTHTICSSAVVALGFGVLTPGLQLLVSNGAVGQSLAAGQLSAASAAAWIVGPVLGLSIVARFGDGMGLAAALACLAPLTSYLLLRLAVRNNSS